MSVAEQELESLRQFVRVRSQRGDGGLSLEDYVCLWRAGQEREETIAAIQEGLDDLEQGHVRPADEVMRELRRRLG